MSVETLTSLKELATTVRSNKEFRKMLKDCRPELRRQVYEQLKPLMNFKVGSYLALKP